VDISPQDYASAPRASWRYAPRLALCYAARDPSL